jgi:60 kDa SS-A/Ro ribonucleoprotein
MKLNQILKMAEKLRARPDATVNHEGALAFKPSSQLDLYLRACTCLVEDRFYTKADQQLAELRTAIQACERSYVLKLANYTRNQMHLRTLPMILLAEASVMHSGDSKEAKNDVRSYVPKVVKRADEPGELLAYWIRRVGEGSKAKLPNALKKGLSDALRRFDEYQLAKYNRAGEVKLRDVLMLTHARPDSPERAALYKRVLEDKLATPETWEVLISTQGASAETWNKIAPKMGIMALLRNLRNFEQHKAEIALAHAMKVFRDPEKVRESQLLPFRWLAAEREVSGSALKDALREALNLSLVNLPVWQGKTAVFVDLSGSMSGALSARSKVMYIDVASLMGAMATRLSQGEYLVGGFGESYQDIPVARSDSVLSNANKIRKTDVGHSTNAWLTIRALRKRKQVFDRVLLFSDMQCYSTHWGNESLVEEWQRYRREVNPRALLYSVDLAGYGSLQFPQDDSGVVQLAGWSDRVLDLVAALERGQSAVDLIEAEF